MFNTFIRRPVSSTYAVAWTSERLAEGEGEETGRRTQLINGCKANQRLTSYAVEQKPAADFFSLLIACGNRDTRVGYELQQRSPRSCVPPCELSRANGVGESGSGL